MRLLLFRFLSARGRIRTIRTAVLIVSVSGCSLILALSGFTVAVSGLAVVRSGRIISGSVILSCRITVSVPAVIRRIASRASDIHAAVRNFILCRVIRGIIHVILVHTVHFVTHHLYSSAPSASRKTGSIPELLIINSLSAPRLAEAFSLATMMSINIKCDETVFNSCKVCEAFFRHASHV